MKGQKKTTREKKKLDWVPGPLRRAVQQGGHREMKQSRKKEGKEALQRKVSKGRSVKTRRRGIKGKAAFKEKKKRGKI